MLKGKTLLTDRQFIIDALFRLTSCAGEDALLDEIAYQIRRLDKSSVLHFAGDDIIGKYLVYRHSPRADVKYLFLVHADRLQFAERRMEFYREGAYGGDWYLRGQLDNNLHCGSPVPNKPRASVGLHIRYPGRVHAILSSDYRLPGNV